MAAGHGVSIGWVAKLVARYRQGGYEAIGARSRAANRIANCAAADVEY